MGPRTLRRQYRYYSNTIKPFQQRPLCLLTYLQSHWFARNLVVSYPTFFIHQPLHLPAAQASPKCTHAEKLETFIRPGRNIVYKHSGHSCLKSGCNHRDYTFISNLNRAVNYRKTNVVLHAQHKRVAIWGAEHRAASCGITTAAIGSSWWSLGK